MKVPRLGGSLSSHESGNDRVAKACALRKHDPNRAFREFQRLADEGSAAGMFHLAWCYDNAIGTHINRTLAEKLYLSAYEIGHEEGRKEVSYYLGRHFLDQKKYKKAAEAFSLGKEYQFAPSLYHLGRLYARGKGVEKDAREARRILEAAASQGHMLATRDLAHLLMSGRFGLKNMVEGVKLLRRTARMFSERLETDPSLQAGDDRLILGGQTGTGKRGHP